MMAGELCEENEHKKVKKINKTFSLNSDDIRFLEGIDRKSAFLGMLIQSYQNGQMIKPETAGLLKQYKALFGEEPEEVIKKVLLRRISKIENNMKTLQNASPAEVKNRVGGAFLKLNQAYEALIAENENSENKLAMTFGVLFKKTSCNHQSIRRWIRANKEKIEAYHQTIGITDPVLHNKQIGVIKRVQRQKDKADNEKG
jgi:hypothetical protein